MSATRPGSTSPSKGQPNATLIVTVARRRSACARSTIRWQPRIASWTVWFALRWEKASVAPSVACTSGRSAAARRS
jgi:hypothetical protein